MYEEFRAQRREATQQAREIDWPNEHISELRKEMRDDFYDRLKHAFKPLPALPSADMSHPDVRKVEESLNARGFYIEGGKRPPRQGVKR